MQRIGEHAVVIGASVSGLLTAGALAEAYDRVTVIERDALPDGPADRRAVPQGRHAHVLLPAGQQALEELLPGIGADLVAAGAPTYAALGQMRFSLGGHELARGDAGVGGIVASRPFVEAHIRRRVRAIPNVEIVDGRDALGLLTDGRGDRVTGVRLLRGTPGSVEEVLPTDLVAAATGRGGRVPAWLEQLGHQPPASERLAVRIGYASRQLRLEPGALGPDRLFVFGPSPDHPRGFVLCAQDGDRWLLTLTGYDGHHPPGDPEGFLAFAQTVLPPEVMAAIRDAVPLGGISTHGFAANERRRYEWLRRFPGGLIVTGDAVCSFNPVYGQGMTVAAREAVALQRCLARGDHRLPQRFFAAAGEVVDAAWEMATASDLAMPQIEGRRPARVRILNAYIGRLAAVAAHDAAVAAAFIRVAGMVDAPPRLLRPRLALRVLAGRRRARPVTGPPAPGVSPGAGHRGDAMTTHDESVGAVLARWCINACSSTAPWSSKG